VTLGRVAETRDQTIVVDAPVSEVFTRVFDVGARKVWSGTVGRVQLLRELDPDVRSWSVERRILARRIAVVYHVSTSSAAVSTNTTPATSAAMPERCVEVRVSIDGSGVVARYELTEIPGGTSVHITAAEFCRGGRPSRRVAMKLHRLARLLERDDEMLLGPPGPASRSQTGDVSPRPGTRHNHRR